VGIPAPDRVCPRDPSGKSIASERDHRTNSPRPALSRSASSRPHIRRTSTVFPAPCEPATATTSRLWSGTTGTKGPSRQHPQTRRLTTEGSRHVGAISSPNGIVTPRARPRPACFSRWVARLSYGRSARLGQLAPRRRRIAVRSHQESAQRQLRPISRRRALVPPAETGTGSRTRCRRDQ